jgi:DNA-binding transcriptional LysR family regulator
MSDARLLSGIEVLAAIVETGSLKRASQVLGLSDSGVSRALARLESRLGLRLIDRTTRSLRLTESGARFYAEIVPLSAQIAEAAATLADTGRAVRGRLRVELDPYFSRLVLAPRLADFLSRYPELELDLVTTETAGDLVAQGFDCAIRFGEPANAGLMARKLLDTRVLTVAAPRYLSRCGRPPEPAHLVDHQCIQYRDPQSRRLFDWEFRRGDQVLPVKVAGSLTVNDVGTLLEACMSGVGIAQILELGTRSLLESGTLVELFPNWSGETFPLYAFHASRHQPSPKVRALTDFCASLARQITVDEAIEQQSVGLEDLTFR